MRPWFALAVLLVACSSEGGDQAPSCPPDYEAKGGACVARLDTCADGELTRIGGGCTPVGARTCGEGFVAAATSGCDVVLPATPCARGEMAIPGDTTCRPVAECGAGTFGAIPVEANTVYVDASYAGADADGSAARPFPTVQRGVDAARVNAIVAIAAGRYLEDVSLGIPVRLWGVCPQKVEIVGVSAVFAVDVTTNAEVHSLAITGPDTGLGVYQGKVLADRVWIHDAGGRGVDLEDGKLGPGELVLRNSLIESSGLIGAFSQGSRLRIERSVVRDTHKKIGTPSYGILARATPETQRRSELSVIRSVVSGNASNGILVNASSGLIEDSFVTDTRPLDGKASGGINANDLESGVAEPHTTLTVRRSGVSKAFGVGIDALHAEVELADVTVRAIDGVAAAGVFLEHSNGTVAGVTIEDVTGHGLAVTGGLVDVRRAVVRRIGLRPDLTGGFGIFAVGSLVIDGRFSVSESVVRSARTMGIALVGGVGSVSDTYVGEIAPDGHGEFGDGIATMAGRSSSGRLVPASLEVRRVVVKDAARGGIIAFAAEASVQGSLLCSGFDMQVVRKLAVGTGEVVEGPASIVDLGANACGCDAPHPCRAELSTLQPIDAPVSE